VKSKRVTDVHGDVVSKVELDPWGGETTHSSNLNQAFQPRKFTSYIRDAIGSDDAMHRRYNSGYIRFDQPDPYNGSYNLTNPQSFNRYSYVHNDPVNFIDPTGLEDCGPADWCGESNPQTYPIDEWVELAHKFAEQAPIELTEAALKRIGEFKLYHTTEYIERVLKPAWDSGDKRKLFLEVFASFIIRTDLIGWHLRQELESFLFEDLGAEFLIEWVSKDPKKRAHHLAEVIGPPVGRPSDLHAILLEKFDAEGVGRAYAARFMSGSFVGSASDWVRGKLQHAKEWLTDERPVIVEWAKRLIRSLEKDLERELAREEEEPLLD
jgi:RHS repeat-associated protein